MATSDEVQRPAGDVDAAGAGHGVHETAVQRGRGGRSALERGGLVVISIYMKGIHQEKQPVKKRCSL